MYLSVPSVGEREEGLEDRPREERLERPRERRDRPEREPLPKKG